MDRFGLEENAVEQFLQHGENITIKPEDGKSYISYQDLLITEIIQISIIIVIVSIVGYFIFKRIKKEEK